MKKGIAYYFSKKPKLATSHISHNSPSRKRKTAALSSDEEKNDKSEKNTCKKKILKLSTDDVDEMISKRQKSNSSQVDLESVFGGETSRGSKIQHGKTEKEIIVEASSKTGTPLYTTPNKAEVYPQHKRRSTRTPKKSPKIVEAKSPDKTIVRKKIVCDNPKEEEHQQENQHIEVKKIKINKIIIKSPKQQGKNDILNSDDDTNKKNIQNNHSDMETSILSDEERFERKRAAALLYQKYKNRQSVINPGSKEVPKGKPNCLEGLSFLVTGVLESIEREEANSIIKKLGGKISTTVGKRLNYLIAGEDAGPKKLADAETFNIPILNVDSFFNLIREKSGEKNKIYIKNESILNDTSSIKPNPIKEDKKEIFIIKEDKLDHVKVKQDNQNIIIDEGNLPWVEKYKPTTVKQIIGQQGPTSNANKLINWLKNWHSNHDGKKKLQKPNPWSKNDDGSYFKAALLSGPPGIGKTTTATLVCKELQFDAVEFNASDTRSKRLLKEEVSELLSNKSLYGYFSGSTQHVSKKHVLIMDEVDGMAGNEDRGGIQELIALIKDSHVPIICMCNDRSHPKMRSLVNYCYDLRFNRPRLEQIKGFVRSVCFKEKVKLSTEKIDEIIHATNNDIRQTINHISILSADKDVAVELNDKKTAQKDLKIGPWEIVRKVFSIEEHKTMSLADKADLFFHDYSMTPLFVQQNYLIVSPSGSKLEIPKKVALTADALSVGDMIETRIRSNSAWVLLPVQGIFSSVLPGEYMEGQITGQIKFPGWLGKYSRANKRKRIAQEIHDHTRLRTSGSCLSIRMDYAQFLLEHIIRPLKKNGHEGVEKSLKILQEYRLLREDIDSLVEITSWPGKKSPLDAIDGRVKAALTKAYNKEILPYSYSFVSTIKKKKMEETDGIDIDEEEAEDISEDENENDKLELDNLIKAKKKILSTTKASTSAGIKSRSFSKLKAKKSKQ